MLEPKSCYLERQKSPRKKYNINGRVCVGPLTLLCFIIFEVVED